MLKTNRSVKNCCFSNNGLPVDKICHLNLTTACHRNIISQISIGQSQDFNREI
jgi:hypothetical protein